MSGFGYGGSGEPDMSGLFAWVVIGIILFIFILYFAGWYGVDKSKEEDFREENKRRVT